MPAVFSQFLGEPQRLAMFGFYTCLDHGSQVRVLGVIASEDKKPVAAGDQLGDGIVGAKTVTDDRGQTARPRGMGSLIGFKPNSFSTLECSFASQTGSKRAYRSRSNLSKEFGSRSSCYTR